MDCFRVKCTCLINSLREATHFNFERSKPVQKTFCILNPLMISRYNLFINLKQTYQFCILIKTIKTVSVSCFKVDPARAYTSFGASILLFVCVPCEYVNFEKQSAFRLNMNHYAHIIFFSACVSFDRNNFIMNLHRPFKKCI